jgi:hypothetical protein
MPAGGFHVRLLHKLHDLAHLGCGTEIFLLAPFDVPESRSGMFGFDPHGGDGGTFCRHPDRAFERTPE